VTDHSPSDRANAKSGAGVRAFNRNFLSAYKFNLKKKAES
jgi:hypothetical protein